MNETLRLRTVLRSSFVRLGPDEVDYFVKRVRTSSKAAPSPSAHRITWLRLAVRVAVSTARAQKTCAGFSRGIAYMDHSDNGIRALFDRAGVPWEEPEKLQLSRSERLLAAVVAFRLIRVNRAGLRTPLQAERTDLALAADRLAVGAGCFGRFVAQAVLAPDSWRGLFLTVDVSFLRMFACYAAVRVNRPTSLFRGHRIGSQGFLPVTAEALFTFDATAAEGFILPPRKVIVDTLGARRRPNPFATPYDVGIITDNFVGMSEVWATTEEVAGHPSVRHVLLRLHPGSKVTELRRGLPDCVTLCDSQESLSRFSERVDLALASNSTAVMVLQDLLVPCFHIRHLYSPNDPWGRRDRPLIPTGRHPLPEVMGTITEFFDVLSPASLAKERDRLRPVEGITADPVAARERVREALQAYL